MHGLDLIVELQLEPLGEVSRRDKLVLVCIEEHSSNADEAGASLICKSCERK